MAQVIKTTFRLRRGYASKWEQVNPILESGEPGWAVDTYILKIGDGQTRWNDLRAVNDIKIDPADIEKGIEEYFEKHPINLVTDATLSVAGQAADAAAVREKCLFNTDTLILCGGNAAQI